VCEKKGKVTFGYGHMLVTALVDGIYDCGHMLFTTLGEGIYDHLIGVFR
jgi:hypothetical protein